MDIELFLSKRRLYAVPLPVQHVRAARGRDVHIILAINVPSRLLGECGNVELRSDRLDVGGCEPGLRHSVCNNWALSGDATASGSDFNKVAIHGCGVRSNEHVLRSNVVWRRRRGGRPWKRFNPGLFLSYRTRKRHVCGFSGKHHAAVLLLGSHRDCPASRLPRSRIGLRQRVGMG
jgi:hypothetical protein